MKRGKLIQLNYDFVLGQPDEVICVPLSRATIAMLLPLLEFQHWKTRWHSLEGTEIVQDTIDDLTDNAIKELMDEEGCMSDPCCPEQIALLNQLLQGQNADYSRQLQTADDGTPQSFAPNAPAMWDGTYDPDSPYSNTNYDAALCQAVNDFMAAAIQRAGQDLGLGSTILGLIGTLVGTFFPPAGFVAAVVVGLTQAAFQAAMADTQAYNNVICCILRGLRGQAISAESLSNALEASGCELSEVNEGIFASIFRTHAANVNNYRSFTAHYANALSTSNEATNCNCCETGQDDMRLDYSWFRASNLTDGYTRVREQSMTRDGNILHITTYQSTYMVNDNEYGFRLYSPSGCCQRMRFLNRNDFHVGSGNFSPYHPPMAQREGVVVECPPADGFTTGSAWFCAEEVRFRWAENGTTHPAWLDDIQIELDPDFVC